MLKCLAFALLLATSVAIVEMSLCEPVSKAYGEDAASEAMPVTLPGVPNLYRVSPGLYRSAQPSAEGIRNLQTLGVKTVVNLRFGHSDRDELRGTTIAGEHISMKAWHAEEEDALRFLKIVTDPAKQPVLVHCHYGSDRTGTMVALYRIVVEGWPKERALAEMTGDKFGFHPVWRNLLDWINSIDLNQLKKSLPDSSSQ